MKKAFTMIELIFVITIIGILAAVATSKLSAVREDAKSSLELSNLAMYIEDISSHYMGTGLAEVDHSNAQLKCFDASLEDVDNIVTITIKIGGEDNNTKYCTKAQKYAEAHNMVGDSMVVIGGALMEH